ncbi:hypothetical protein KI387_024138, partial [Taxus chinensis]
RQATPENLSSFSQRSQEAMSILLQSIRDEFLMHIGHMDSPANAWKQLETMHE